MLNIPLKLLEDYRESSLVLCTMAVIKFYSILRGATLALLLHLNMGNEKEKKRLNIHLSFCL